MARQSIDLQTIAPLSRSATGVNTFVQHYADPSAGAGLADLAKALGFAADTMAEKDEKKQKEFENNLQYYASEFAKDKDIGLVDATQVGRAYPDASPIVVGRITELVGSRWANEVVRSRMDEFLADESKRLNPQARREFFASLRSDIAKSVEGRPFFGNGALSATESIIREYEGSFQRESAQFNQQVQEEDFKTNVSEALQGRPVTEAAGDAAGLLTFISMPESGGNYNAYYGHANNGSIRFTDMSLDEVLDWQRRQIIRGSSSSAVGRYQFIHKTLRGLKDELGLSGSEQFSPELQDKLGVALLKRRGWDDYKAGRITKEQFANNLAQEWAGLPVVSGPGAGLSYYHGDAAGNSAGVGVDDFLAAIDSKATPVDPVSYLDNIASQTSSINPIRRRELVVSTAIDLALSSRDTSILERIPQNMRGVPDIEARITKTQEQVRDLLWQDYIRQQQVQENDRKRQVSETRQEILDRLASGEKINPAEYAKFGDEVYDYAVKVQNDEFVDPVSSAAKAAQIRDTILRGATIGELGEFGNLSFDGAVQKLQEADGLRITDKKALIDELPTLLEGMNLLNDPQISSFYSNRIGADVQVYLQSAGGTLDRLTGTNIAGSVRRSFDETVRAYVRASIEEGQGIPRGIKLIEILEKAEDKALKKLESLRAIQPTQQTAQTNSKQDNTSVDLTDDEEALLKKYLEEN